MRITSSILFFLIFLIACNSQAVQNSTVDSENPTRKTELQNIGINENTSRTDLKKEKTMSDQVLKSVTLKAQAENTENALVIKYEVENHTEQTLYLWDGMVSYPGTEKGLDHDSAYVFFEEPKTLRVIRAVLPLPTAFDIGKKEIPFARALAPLSKLTGKITLKHPIKEYSPYYEPMKEENQKAEKFSEIRLLIGWTRPRTGMTITERQVGGEKVFALRGGWQPPYQEILEEFLSVPGDLLTYSTPFERMLPLK